jgi:hypothetical protein
MAARISIGSTFGGQLAIGNVMSSIRINILDSEQTINGEIHGSVGDTIVAALTAEPETIDELALALERFIPRESDLSPFHYFSKYENFEPYDAGVVVVDLAARVIAVDSTYSCPGKEGSILIHPRFSEEEDFTMPYRLSDEWLVVGSIPEYEGIRTKRREERMSIKPFDVREVLYEKPLLEFIARECVENRNSDDEELFTKIHAKWYMTPREDLRGKTPREVLFEKRDFIDFDLHSRSIQWSFGGECPPPLSFNSNAYRYAGIGIHEWVVYYYLIRDLLAVCFEKAKEEISPDTRIEQLEKFKNDWLESPSPEFSGRIPAQIIEWERKRVNLTMSAMEAIVDEDCEICQMMAADFNTPMFWHLDGCNMDEGFVFSYNKTLEEYENEQKEWEEFNRKFEEDRKAGKYDKPFDDSLIDFDDDEEDIPF